MKLFILCIVFVFGCHGLPRKRSLVNDDIKPDIVADGTQMNEADTKSINDRPFFSRDPAVKAETTTIDQDDSAELSETSKDPTFNSDGGEETLKDADDPPTDIDFQGFRRGDEAFEDDPPLFIETLNGDETSKDIDNLVDIQLDQTDAFNVPAINAATLDENAAVEKGDQDALQEKNSLVKNIQEEDEIHENEQDKENEATDYDENADFPHDDNDGIEIDDPPIYEGYKLPHAILDENTAAGDLLLSDRDDSSIKDLQEGSDIHENGNDGKEDKEIEFDDNQNEEEKSEKDEETCRSTWNC